MEENKVVEETKKCPYCGETILKVAKKCRYCGEWLEESNYTFKVKEPNSTNRNLLKNKKILLVLGIVCALAVFYLCYAIYQHVSFPEKLKNYNKTSYELFIASSYLNDINKSAWQECIFSDDIYFNKKNGIIKKINIYSEKSFNSEDWEYCKDFNIALSKRSYFNTACGLITYIDSLYEVNKEQLKHIASVKNDVEEYNQMFQANEKLYRYAKSPEGNFQAYCGNINTFRTDFQTHFSQANLDNASIEDIKSEISQNVLSYLKSLEFSGANNVDKLRRIEHKAYIDINNKWLTDNSKKEGVKVTSSGLQYKVLKQGNGKKAKKDSMVEVHYEGKTIDGVIFDSSYNRNSPLQLRASQVIKGWTEALTMMQEGSIWEVYIPEHLAYGDKEAGSIKPYSTLIFKIELIKVLY